MARFRIVNGERVDFTPEEEIERDAQEAAWATEVATRKPEASIHDELAALRKAVLTGVKTDLEAIDAARKPKARP